MKKLESLKKLKGPYSVKRSDVKTGAWRHQRPVIDPALCIKCGICGEYCPCGVVDTAGERVTIDYTYCKGCGICVEECPKKAIRFVPEREFAGEGGTNHG
ncbi:MAG: 4Fe-4S dicluster domain-containing protein [Clostridia bacterium]|nr:4Fe-4S binding protein [Candidatus Pelethousia sp.]NCB30294.1 4Fe-4S dicluster domain-containing protein [Clostridia bacterium]